MNEPTDSQLLRAYAEDNSEAAFSELVRRHVDLVYSAARRMVRDPHLAEDVTQGAFVALARNAAQLADRSVLSGWLHRTAQNIAAQMVRTIERRRAREHEAAAMNELLSHQSDAAWEDIAPHLDAALGALNEADRDAVMLRYFERKSAHEMALVLGITNEAAQKRVTRAVERVRGFLAQRGVTVGGSGLAVVISANAVQAAPVGLAVTISTTAALAGTTIATTLTAAVSQTIAMTTLQKTFVAAAFLAAVSTAIHEARQAALWRDRSLALHKQIPEQIQQAQRERDDAARVLAALRDENKRLQAASAELHLLRSEVARLRAGSPLKANTDRSEDGTETEAALRSWLGRVKTFKQLPDRMPDRSIPELRLLNEEDWLELAKRPLGHAAKEVNLDDDATARLVFRAIRAKAKDKLMRVLSRALEGYARENGGHLPDDTLQLKPHLMNTHFLGAARVLDIPESAVDDSILRRYDILQTGKLEDVSSEATILAERAPVDGEYDTRLRLGRYWMGISELDTYLPGKGATMD